VIGLAALLVVGYLVWGGRSETSIAGYAAGVWQCDWQQARDGETERSGSVEMTVSADEDTDGEFSASGQGTDYDGIPGDIEFAGRWTIDGASNLTVDITDGPSYVYEGVTLDAESFQAHEEDGEGGVTPVSLSRADNRIRFEFGGGDDGDTSTHTFTCERP